MNKSKLLLDLAAQNQVLIEKGESLLFDEAMSKLENAIIMGDYCSIKEVIEELCQIIFFRIYPVKLSDSHKYSNLCVCLSYINAWVEEQKTEWCSNCELDVIVDWSNGMSSACPNCGDKIVFCNKCSHQGESCHLCKY